jgi:hypothetical protein
MPPRCAAEGRRKTVAGHAAGMHGSQHLRPSAVGCRWERRGARQLLAARPGEDPWRPVRPCSCHLCGHWLRAPGRSGCARHLSAPRGRLWRWRSRPASCMPIGSRTNTCVGKCPQQIGRVGWGGRGHAVFCQARLAYMHLSGARGYPGVRRHGTGSAVLPSMARTSHSFRLQPMAVPEPRALQLPHRKPANDYAVLQQAVLQLLTAAAASGLPPASQSAAAGWGRYGTG